MNKKEMDISQIIDLEKLSPLMDSFCHSVGIASAIIDLDGRVFISSNWQSICTDFHRQNPETCKKCIESDTYLANQLNLGEKYAVYTCRNGLTDAASPIIVQGKRIANVFVGQFLLKEASTKDFRKQAEDYKFDIEKYLQALSLVPIVSEEKVRSILEYLVSFAELLGDMGMNHIKQVETNILLQESEKKYRSLIEYSPMGILIVQDNPPRIRFANKGLQKILGFNFEELAEFDFNDYTELIHADDRKTFFKNFRYHLKGKYVPEQCEYKVFHKDGKIRLLETYSTKIDYNGSSAVQMFFLDNTERKKNEEEIKLLQEQTGQFSKAAASVIAEKDEKKLFNSISEIIVKYSDYRRVLISYFKNEPPYRDIIGFAGVDSKSVDRLRKIDMPKDWYLGIFQKGTKIGQFSSYIPHTMKDLLKAEATLYGSGEMPETDDKWHPEDNLFVEMRDEQQNLIGVISVDTSKSGKKPTAETISPLEIFSSLISQAIISRKAESERIILEEQLFQAQKMESIGRLAGGIAHDFNNILTSIMGYAELLKLKLQDTSVLEGEAADIILKGTERAADLTKQLLGFARGGKYNPEPLNINSVIRENVKVSEKILEKKITVEFDLESRIHTIEADKNQMNQIFTNLIINANDAMPKGGSLTFKTENVFLDELYTKRFPEFKEGFYIKISVTDRGIGITKEVIQYVFEPFFSTKGEKKGTGLGLATVYGIVKNHKGHISVYSEPGKGATFSIYFPITDKEIEAAQKEIHSPKKNSGATILVVDDEEHVIKLARAMLDKLGYNVITAKDGVEAMKIFTESWKDIDLVLLDMIMPDKAGKETYLEMKTIDSRVKVILSSGYSQNGLATEILEEGVHRFVQKPYRMHELSEAIEDVLRK
ncbi:PocR ligand-binding domain-containing protein [candidate division KSB1 bacterium]